MTKIYEYHIEENGKPVGFSFDLQTRQDARKYLKQLKIEGYLKAYIVQKVFKLETTKKVR